MLKITPLNDNVIVRIIEQENKLGMFVIPDQHLAQSTLAEVLIPAAESYYRNGELRQNNRVKKGDIVRLPKGSIGTEMPEAPEGQQWVAVPEDCISYIVNEVKTNV